VTSVVWFRRDLRLADHPALTEAAAAGEPVVALFVCDRRLLAPSGAARLAFLAGCLGGLDQSIDGHLVVRSGSPAAVVAAVAEEVDATAVYVSDDFGPYGRRRDERVAGALAAAGRSFEAVGSPYAVDPGAVRTQDGGAFRVFTPFYRAWQAHGWPDPLPPPSGITWVSDVKSDGIPAAPSTGASLPRAGEAAARARLTDFLADRAATYDTRRDRPGDDATTRLSAAIKFGCVHPRQILDRLGRSKAHENLRRELAWREFYADVLWHRPESAHQPLQAAMAALRVDSGRDADELFVAWTAGRTGYPLVDAGMRQLLGEAWMHNRVRMVTASFLVKDLHIDWRRGARWFLEQLVDGDLASNNHGWQWVAGIGTDPAPYFRIFNPTAQAREHDPEGSYIRRWVPELADLPVPSVFEPWKLAGGPPNGYPLPVVDHPAERREALDRYAELRPLP
jgi:deoxyribodipyrimidine photo-lyase